MLVDKSHKVVEIGNVDTIAQWMNRLQILPLSSLPLRT